MKQPLPLDPAELVVTSFQPEPTATFLSPITITDPTAETRCFVCPVYTENCY